MACLACIAVGVVALVYGFNTDPQRTWANYLLINYYFFLIAIGAAFFLAIQSISRSRWSAGFRRVYEALMMYIPVAGILLTLLYFGMGHLYHWTHEDVISSHEIIRHKTPYLNIPFFFARLVLFFSIWTLLLWLMRRSSLREDQLGGMENFYKAEKYSRIFIFFLAISITLLGFDLLMSIDAEWFSTIYALKSFIGAFQHGTVVIFIVIVLLNKSGHFEFLNASHIHDFARYIFIVSIFYGYFWFSQFMLIWYSNIPEETIYYATRWTPEWKFYWVADIVVNWAIPFFVLLPVITSRKKWIVFGIAVLLLAGRWIDLYISIFPGAVGESRFGIIEAGSFLGFAGLFAIVTGFYLSKASIVPVKHPFLNESIHHHFESYI